MKRLLIYGILPVVLLLIFSCKGNQKTEGGMESQGAPQEQQVITDTVKTVYTCPMHPEIVSDTMGTCPRCGMDLEVRS